MIIREQTPDRINSLWNHPGVRIWADHDAATPIDLSAIIADNRNLALTAEYGAVLFTTILPGICQAHVRLLPSVSPEWTRGMIAECWERVFTTTQVTEILATVPRRQTGLLQAVEALGAHREFTTQDGPTDAAVFGCRTQDWAYHAPGMIKRGSWFFERLGQEAARLGIAFVPHDDDVSRRWAGVSAAMAFGGQYVKSAALWNRYVAVARSTPTGPLHPVSLMSVDPFVVRTAIGPLKFARRDIELLREC